MCMKIKYMFSLSITYSYSAEIKSIQSFGFFFYEIYVKILFLIGIKYAVYLQFSVFVLYALNIQVYKRIWFFYVYYFLDCH